MVVEPETLAAERPLEHREPRVPQGDHMARVERLGWNQVALGAPPEADLDPISACEGGVLAAGCRDPSPSLDSKRTSFDTPGEPGAQLALGPDQGAIQGGSEGGGARPEALDDEATTPSVGIDQRLRLL